MTVIAGASLFSGVILLADTRATIRLKGRRDLHCDIAQKLIPLTPSTVVGFSGSVHAADQLLRTAITQLRSRAHQDAMSMRLWLPRFLKTSYRRYAKRHGSPHISFLVGSVILGRANLIERAKVVPLFETIGFGRSPIKRSFVPDIVMRIMMTPSTQRMFPAGACQNLLYSLSSPDFVARDYAPLEFCAIGSGQKTTVEIAKTADWLLAGQPGNDLTEVLALTDAVSEFIAAEGIEDVGGMFPCMKIDARGAMCLGNSTGLPSVRVSIAFNQKLRRWVQRNEATGKEIRLLLPWEIDASKINSDMRFDDWHEAIRRFNPRRLQRRS